MCTSRALHERDDLLDHRLSNKKEFPKGNNNTNAIKNPRKPTKNQNTKSKQQPQREKTNAIGRFFLFVGFVDFPFRAINLHCANVVIVVFAVVLVLFFIIKIYNIYCHKPDGDYNIWSSTPQHAAARTPQAARRAQEMRMRSTKEKRENRRSFGSRSQRRSRLQKARCVIVYTQNRYQIQGLRLALVFVWLRLSLATWEQPARSHFSRLTFCAFLRTFLGAGAGCGCVGSGCTCAASI